MYTTEDLAALLNVTPQTVRARSDEFESHLSPSANPGKGRVRKYTDRDARMMLLINTMHNDGAWVSEIHKALDEDKLPELPTPNDTSLAAKPESERGLSSQLTELQIALASEKGENRLLREQLADAQAEIKALNREIGRLEARKNNE